MCILENSKPILLYVVNILKGLSPRKSNIRSLEFQIYPLALNNIQEQKVIYTWQWKWKMFKVSIIW